MGLFRKKPLTLQEFGEFAGFFAAHFLWQTEGHENVVPLVAVQRARGKPGFERFEANEYVKAAADATERYNELKEHNPFALLALDGRIPLKGNKCEAVIIQACFREAAHIYEITFAIPYAWKGGTQQIYEVQILDANLPDTGATLVDIEKGAANHGEAFAYWQQHKEHTAK